MSGTTACTTKGCELEGIDYEVEDTSLQTFCGMCGARMLVPGETAPVEDTAVVYEVEADPATMIALGLVPEQTDS